MAKPVVTAINGAAMGGGAGLAIAGDLAVMAESATLGYPETKHGIVAAIVMANLVRQAGRKAAFELVALGEPVDAQRALALGLVNRVVPRRRSAARGACSSRRSSPPSSRPAMQAHQAAVPRGRRPAARGSARARARSQQEHARLPQGPEPWGSPTRSLAMLCFAANIIITRYAVARLPVEAGFFVVLATNILFPAALFASELALRAAP